MTSLDKVADELEGVLCETGYTMSDVINYLGQRNSKLLMLDDISHRRYVELYDAIVSGKLTKTEKGKRLEELTGLLLKDSVNGLFDVYRNCRTSSNEIDILVRWTDNARMANINLAYPCFGESFLCECKNYNGKVNVTYVGKFCSLMCVTGVDLGIMVAWEGITSRGKWSDSNGLIKKFALKENKYIVVLSKDDFKRIYNREANIFSLVNDKYLALKSEIDYKEYILQHEAESVLKC